MQKIIIAKDGSVFSPTAHLTPLDVKGMKEKIAELIRGATAKKPENYRVVPGVPENGRTEAICTFFPNLSLQEKVAIREFIARKAVGILERLIRKGEDAGIISRKEEFLLFGTAGDAGKLGIFLGIMKEECAKFKMAVSLYDNACGMEGDKKRRFEKENTEFALLFFAVEERLAEMAKERMVVSEDFVNAGGFAKRAGKVPVDLMKVNGGSVLDAATVVSEALKHIKKYLGRNLEKGEISMNGKLQSLSPEAKMVLHDEVLEIVVSIAGKIAGKVDVISIPFGEFVVDAEGGVVTVGDVGVSMSKNSKNYALRSAAKIEYVAGILAESGVECREIKTVAQRIRELR